MGNLLLLKDKLVEANDKWEALLLQGKEDHRYTQGISCLLRDLIKVLPNK